MECIARQYRASVSQWDDPGELNCIGGLALAAKPVASEIECWESYRLTREEVRCGLSEDKFGAMKECLLEQLVMNNPDAPLPMSVDDYEMLVSPEAEDRLTFSLAFRMVRGR